MNTPTNTPTSKCKSCEEDGEILPGSVHMIGAINCRIKPATPTTDSKNTTDTGWESRFDDSWYAGSDYNSDNEKWFVQAINGRDPAKAIKDFIRREIEKVAKEEYERGRLEVFKELYSTASIYSDGSHSLIHGFAERKYPDLLEAALETPIGCCEECAFYLDYKDDWQCNGGLTDKCQCHPEYHKPS